MRETGYLCQNGWHLCPNEHRKWGGFHAPVGEGGILPTQSGDERPLYGLHEPPRFVTAHRKIDIIEEFAKIRQRITRVAIFLRGELEQHGIFGGAQVVRLYTTYLASVNPVEMDRYKQVSALGVRQGRTLAQ